LQELDRQLRQMRIRKQVNSPGIEAMLYIKELEHIDLSREEPTKPSQDIGIKKSRLEFIKVNSSDVIVLSSPIKLFMTCLLLKVRSQIKLDSIRSITTNWPAILIKSNDNDIKNLIRRWSNQTEH